MDLLIKNGTIVTAKESYKADVAVNDGKIVAIGSNLDFDANKVVDAGGKLVLPGAIDVHTHLAMPFGGTVSADSYLAGTRAAACGGVTTVFDYPVQHSGETIMGLINSKKEVLEKEACVDYAFHCCITDLKGVTVWVQNLLNVDFANLFVINMYLLTAFVTVFRSFANLNFVN